MSGIYSSILPSAIQKDSLSRSSLAVGNDGISHRADSSKRVTKGLKTDFAFRISFTRICL